MLCRGLLSADHKVERENDEIECALDSERVLSKGKEKFKEKEKVMSADIQQSDQDYVATVEVLQADGEWVVVARAVDGLEGLAERSASGQHPALRDSAFRREVPVQNQ